MIPVCLRAYPETQLIKDVPFPPWVQFRKLLVIGPPGTGKSTLMRRLGGWMEEGHLDLASPTWWRSPVLRFVPRELHLYLPFQGLEESCPVYDKAWLATMPPIDFPRIWIPPAKGGLLSVNWRGKYALEFLLPPLEDVYRQRQARAEQGTHPVDDRLSRDQIAGQLLVFWNVAKHLHRCGLQVYVRPGSNALPMEIVDTMDQCAG